MWGSLRLAPIIRHNNLLDFKQVTHVTHVILQYYKQMWLHYNAACAKKCIFFEKYAPSLYFLQREQFKHVYHYRLSLQFYISQLTRLVLHSQLNCAATSHTFDKVYPFLVVVPINCIVILVTDRFILTVRFISMRFNM